MNSEPETFAGGVPGVDVSHAEIMEYIGFIADFIRETYRSDYEYVDYATYVRRWLDSQPAIPRPDWDKYDEFDSFVMSPYGDEVLYYNKAEVDHINGLPDLVDIDAFGVGSNIVREKYQGIDWRQTLQHRPQETD